MARYRVVDDVASRLYIFPIPAVVGKEYDLPEELVKRHKELVESLEKVESLLLSLMKEKK